MGAPEQSYGVFQGPMFLDCGFAEGGGKISRKKSIPMILKGGQRGLPLDMVTQAKSRTRKGGTTLKQRLGVVSVVVLLTALFALSAVATTAEMYFSTDKNGQNRSEVV